MSNPWDGRHPSVAHFEPMFQYGHLHPDLVAVSQSVAELAERMLRNLQDSPELSAGLRKLVEAKDCFVRQAVADLGQKNVTMKPA